MEEPTMTDTRTVPRRRDRPSRTIAATFLSVCRAIVARFPMQRAVTDLYRTDDRLLRDIGLTRSDVMAASRLSQSCKDSDL